MSKTDQIRVAKASALVEKASAALEAKTAVATGSKTAPSMDALTSTLFDADSIGIEFSYDDFSAAIVLTIDGAGKIQLSDQHYTEARIRLERIGLNKVSKELVRDAIFYVAMQNHFDSAQDWINGLPWDGVKRVNEFFHKYFGAEPCAYTSAVSRYLWTALAGRVISPGCKADMVPVLVGEQGIRKSSGVKAIAPYPSCFAEISLNERDDDLSRMMRGVLVAELGELRGLKGKDQESIKQFLTRSHEKWIPKYQESETTMPRRLVFIGTTNEDEFLSDSTGNRRWLPINVNSVDVDAIEKDRDQLWAEGASLFKSGGVDYQMAELLAIEQHKDFEIQDPWKSDVINWINIKRPRDGSEFQIQISDILDDQFHMTLSKKTNWEATRVARILKQLGYIKKRVSTQTGRLWAYVKKD